MPKPLPLIRKPQPNQARRRLPRRNNSSTTPKSGSNDLTVKASRAAWVQANFITDDTEQMAADANEVLIGATTELAKQGHALRQPEAARRAGAQDAAAEALGRRAGAGARTIPRNWPKWPASGRRSRPTTAKASTARRRASTQASASTSPPSSASWPAAPIPMS